MELMPTNQLLNFSGKVVLVTGGGSGIGAGIAQRFGGTRIVLSKSI